MARGAEAEALWEAASALAAAHCHVSPAARALPPLLFLTDGARTPEPWRVAGRLPPGAGVVYRGFGAADALDQARRLREATQAAGVRLLIGLDAALAEAIGADGVHLPERALDQTPALRNAHPDWTITIAAHSPPAMARAAKAGADAALLSPVFSPGGASNGEALGVERFAAWVRAAALPVYALGGITSANAPSLADSGACGIAAVEAIAKEFAD